MVVSKPFVRLVGELGAVLRGQAEGAAQVAGGGAFGKIQGIFRSVAGQDGLNDEGYESKFNHQVGFWAAFRTIPGSF